MQNTLIVDLNDDNFTSVIEKGTVLVDFYRQVGCQYCRMLVPVLEQFALEMKDKVIVAKVDVFISPKTTTEFQITSVPTLILFHQGKPVQRLIGLQDLKTLKTLLATSLVP